MRRDFWFSLLVRTQTVHVLFVLDRRLPGQVGLTCEQEVPRPPPTLSLIRPHDVPWLAGPRPMRRTGTLADVHKDHSTRHVPDANVAKLNSNGDGELKATLEVTTFF